MLFIKILSHNNKELLFSLLIHYLLSVEKDFPFAAYNSVVYYFITRAELIASSVRICLICNQSEIDSHDRICFLFFSRKHISRTNITIIKKKFCVSSLK